MENDMLSSLLQNPELMEKLQAMAKSLGLNTDGPQASAPNAAPPPPPQPDPVANAMQMFAAVQTDSNQQALLKALGPYLGKDRLNRLERAMRATQLAKLATGMLGGKRNV